MKKDLLIRVSPCIFPDEYVSDKKGNNKELDIDSFSTQPALLNVYGFPTNDIMLYEQSQSESVARSVLQRVDVRKSSGLDEGKFDIEQQFDNLCPANWDSPAEYVRYSSSVARRAYECNERLRAQKEAKEKESQVINFKEGE